MQQKCKRTTDCALPFTVPTEVVAGAQQSLQETLEKLTLQAEEAQRREQAYKEKVRPGRATRKRSHCLLPVPNALNILSCIAGQRGEGPRC